MERRADRRFTFAVLLTVSLTSSFLVALPFHFWGCAITVCTRETQAKSENATVQKHPAEAPELPPEASLGKEEFRKIETPAQDDDGDEKRSSFARFAREGSVDAVSFALPVLRKTTSGHRGKDRIISCLADLVAPRGRYS